jgi:hypothetical protein
MALRPIEAVRWMLIRHVPAFLLKIRDKRLQVGRVGRQQLLQLLQLHAKVLKFTLDQAQAVLRITKGRAQAKVQVQVQVRRHIRLQAGQVTVPPHRVITALQAGRVHRLRVRVVTALQAGRVHRLQAVRVRAGRPAAVAPVQVAVHVEDKFVLKQIL